MPRVILDHLLACQKRLHVLPARILILQSQAGIMQYLCLFHIRFSEGVIKFTLLPSELCLSRNRYPSYIGLKISK